MFFADFLSSIRKSEFFLSDFRSWTQNYEVTFSFLLLGQNMNHDFHFILYSSAIAVNLKACNHFKLYNGKAAEVSPKKNYWLLD